MSRWGPRICISTKFLGNCDAAGPGTPLWEPLIESSIHPFRKQFIERHPGAWLQNKDDKLNIILSELMSTEHCTEGFVMTWFTLLWQSYQVGIFCPVLQMRILQLKQIKVRWKVSERGFKPVSMGCHVVPMDTRLAALLPCDTEELAHSIIVSLWWIKKKTKRCDIQRG